MTIAVTIRNEDTRDSAVILVKHSGEQVHELAAGQATTVHVWAGSNIEIAERPLPGEIPWTSVGLRSQLSEASQHYELLKEERDALRAELTSLRSLHAVPFAPPTNAAAAASNAPEQPQTPPADAPPA